ncbi:MAG: helix-turn-helix transcriptional regulator [Candidatus Limnocylindrales bacterium]
MARSIEKLENGHGHRSFSAPGPDGGGFADDELPAVFELLGRISRAVATTVGPDCEVVVHDLRHPEHTVVAISGHLTGRQVGAPVPDPALLPGEVDKFTADDLRRTATTMAGRELLASTAWVRDAKGHIVGAMCINIDQSGLRRARDLIADHLGDDEGAIAPITTFATDVSDFTRAAVLSILGRSARRRLRRAERIELIRRLDADGIFALRGASEAIAAELHVSRSSVYSDLRVARHGELKSAALAAAAPRPDTRIPRPPTRGLSSVRHPGPARRRGR